jgi:hypothetical protein
MFEDVFGPGDRPEEIGDRREGRADDVCEIDGWSACRIHTPVDRCHLQVWIYRGVDHGKLACPVQVIDTITK